MISRPSPSRAWIWHERTASPSRWTVQAPQSAAPQPNFVAVSRNSSRSSQSSGVSGSPSKLMGFPLTVSLRVIVGLRKLRDARARHRARRGRNAGVRRRFVTHWNRAPMWPRSRRFLTRNGRPGSRLAEKCIFGPKFGPGLCGASTFPIIGPGGWRRTYHALTGSGPEGSSPTDCERVDRQPPILFAHGPHPLIALRAWLALRGGAARYA